MRRKESGVTRERKRRGGQSWKYWRPGREADRQTGRQADKQTGRQAERQTDRQTDR